MCYLCRLLVEAPACFQAAQVAMREAPSSPSASGRSPEPPSEQQRRAPLEQRAERRDRRGKHTLIWRELSLIAALGLLIMAFNINWGNAEGDREVAARAHDEIHLRDVRVTPPEPEPPEPEPEPARRPEPEPEVPKETPRREVPDEELQEEPEPVAEPIREMQAAPTADQAAESASQPAPAPPPDPPKKKIFSHGTADRNAQMIGSIEVEYPAQARRAQIEGRVVLQFVVDESGRPQDIQVLQSPHDLLSRAAVQALQKKRFKPAKQNGQPVKMRMSQPVTFRLD